MTTFSVGSSVRIKDIPLTPKMYASTRGRTATVTWIADNASPQKMVRLQYRADENGPAFAPFIDMDQLRESMPEPEGA